MMTETNTRPALFRAGDIGVSAEWRDLSYDWTPLLTPIGVSMYEQCRDTYDQQRALYPFLLTPQGPTKHAMQRKLGLRTGYALQGPEYLLATVGLLHVEVGTYGPSTDPERPNHTRVAYYVVGRLDHPTLDWPMLQRILAAVHVALEPSRDDPAVAAQQKKAAAALRSLGQAGFLQLCDPDDLLYPLGAWPYLLPALLADPLWERLFTHLHGAAAMQRYRKQGRAWVEYAQRLAARLRAENDVIRDQLLAAQRRGPTGGGPATPFSTPESATSIAHTDQPATAATALGEPANQQGLPITSTPFVAASSQIPATPQGQRGTDPVAVSQAGFVARESPVSRYPVAVSQRGLVTDNGTPHGSTVSDGSIDVAEESLQGDQLTSRRCCQEIDVPKQQGTSETLPPNEDAPIDVPLVAPHLRDAELATTRYDATFWCTVNQLLYGVSERYPHTAGEKKAVERRFKRQDVPVGVVLAALRAVMTLPEHERPQTLGAALTMPVLQACIQQALALLPGRQVPSTDSGSWPAFLQAYRSFGMAGGLRNVSITDYHVLYGLFQAQPGECWEVLNRVEHATEPPDLSPAYLRRAIINNQQAAARQLLTMSMQPASCRSEAIVADGKAQAPPFPPAVDDPRRALLEHVNLDPALLQPWMTVEYIQAWLDEAAARPNLKNPRGWLVWGLGEGCLPQEHPKLPPRPSAKPALASFARRYDKFVAMAGGGQEQASGRPDLQRIWDSARARLCQHVGDGRVKQVLDGMQLVDLVPDPAAPGTMVASLTAYPDGGGGTSDMEAWHQVLTTYGGELEMAIAESCGCPARLAQATREHAATAGADAGRALPGWLPQENTGDPRPSHRQLWARALSHLATQLPPSEFETWIKESALLEIDGDEAIIGVPTVFAREILGSRYGDLIGDTLEAILQRTVRVQVVIGCA